MFSIENAIVSVTKAMEAGVDLKLIRACLFSDGWKAKRVNQIMLWAERIARTIQNSNTIDTASEMIN